MKTSATPVCAEKESAILCRDDDVLPTHSADRHLWKTVKAVVSTTLASATIPRKAQPPDSERMDETVSAVASLVVVEIVCETLPAGAVKRMRARTHAPGDSWPADYAGEGDVEGGDNTDSEAVSGPVGQDETIVGSGDRAHHLSLKFANIAVALRQEPIGKTELIAPRRPLSRAECHRRCGKAGFCDPASELGCGGEYCGNLHAF